MPTLDDVMAALSRIELRLTQQEAALGRLVAGENLMATQLDTLIQSLNDNTNAVSARIDRLVATIGNQDNQVTPAELAELQALSDHLKALGQDPQNPVPPVPPQAP